MKIGIIERTKLWDVYLEYRPRYHSWYKAAKSTRAKKEKKKGRVTIERAVFRYLRRRYPENTYTLIDPYKMTQKAYRAKVAKLDKVWLGFEDSTNLFKQGDRRSSKILKEIMGLKNIFPKARFVKFIEDKCKYYPWFSKNGVPVLPTKCFSLGPAQVPKIIKFAKKYPAVWTKTIPSGEAYGNSLFKRPYDEEEIKEYIEALRYEEFEKVVVQKYESSFATPKNPERRTFWLDGKYIYGITTNETGTFQSEIKRLPPKLRKLGNKVMGLIKKRFGEYPLNCRLDFGRTPNGKFFVNEIEIAYATWADYLDNKHVYEKLLGDALIKRLQKR